MEAKLKKKVGEWRSMTDLIVKEGGMKELNDVFQLTLIAAVLVLAAEVEDVKDEVRNLGNIVSKK